jgi:DNA end-binding protein Ku
VPDPDSDELEELPEQGARGFWSGTLSFGLVSIPVSLHSAHRSQRAGFRMLAQDGTPLARRYYCPEDGQELTGDDIVRGYQLDSGELVQITDEELEALAPKKSRDIDLRVFVPAGSVDPFYHDQSYFLVPAAESTKAYRLLAQTMERTERIGIATFVMRGSEYVIAIEAERGLLRAETLHYEQELRPLDELGLPPKPRVPAPVVEQYRSAINRLAAEELDMREPRDQGAELLQQLAERKRARRQDVVEVQEAAGEQQQTAEVIDLMQALKRSLASHGQTSERATGRQRGGQQRPSAPGPHKARPRSGPGLRKAAAEPALSDLSKRALYERACALDVRGRTTMSRDELVRAVRKAQNG